MRLLNFAVTDQDGDKLEVLAHTHDSGPLVMVTSSGDPEDNRVAMASLTRAEAHRLSDALAGWLFETDPTLDGDQDVTGRVFDQVTTETITAEAERAVYGDRDDDYGHPRANLTRTAIIWTGLLHHKLADGVHLEPEDVARLQIGVKLSRDVNEPKRDNRVDIAGYALALDRLETGQ